MGMTGASGRNSSKIGLSAASMASRATIHGRANAEKAGGRRSASNATSESGRTRWAGSRRSLATPVHESKRLSQVLKNVLHVTAVLKLFDRALDELLTTVYGDEPPPARGFTARRFLVGEVVSFYLGNHRGRLLSSVGPAGAQTLGPAFHFLGRFGGNASAYARRMYRRTMSEALTPSRSARARSISDSLSVTRMFRLRVRARSTMYSPCNATFVTCQIPFSRHLPQPSQDPSGPGADRHERPIATSTSRTRRYFRRRR